jgi:isoleucyl-tRNA synthetase
MTTTAKRAVKSWSSTLRLPKSSFPARPSNTDVIRYLERCADDLYSWQSQQRSATNTFTLHDGPPYANGNLHVGHALNKILKDIVSRTELAQGKRVNYVPGWDCHGLPIELKALEHHGWKKGGDHGPVAVREAARAFADTAVQEQMRGFKSWGIMGDWKGHWKTMDKDFELRQLSVFKELARKGLIYRRHKPVYWSPSSGTALAEAELEYKDDHVSTAALVKFPLVHHPFDQNDQLVSAVVWTTTPWTIPANQAIAVGKDLEYVVVRSKAHGNLLLARSRLDFVSALAKEDLQDVQSTISGSELLDARPKYRSLFNIHDSTRPLFHADFVKSDAGTGLVHSAPGHGMDDYLALWPLIQEQEVSVLAPVDSNGCFTAEAIPDDGALLKGLNVLTNGNKTVLHLLKEQQSLITSYNYVHSSPYDWRTKQPVIVRATAQWFADVSNIREETIACLENVRFFPAGGKVRLKSFVENRSEWCISRQRAWGVPIPALYRRTNDEALLTEESIDHIIGVIEKRGIDAWWSDSAGDPGWIPPRLLQNANAEDFRRGRDTMDVWFDSGTSWSQLQGGIPSNGKPLADIYLEGTDQHRGWFQSSVLTRVAYQKSTHDHVAPTAPFRSLITHGFTLDAKGKKMSKSEGNVIAPEEIIRGRTEAVDSKKKGGKNSKAGSFTASLGPDALRLWVASSDFAKDVMISDTVIKNVHSALHKYRVTFKLLLGALEGFNPKELVPYSQLNQMDRIALYQLSLVKQTVLTTYKEYEFHRAVSAINRWISTDLSGFYIEAIKDSLYCDDGQSSRRRAIQTTLYHILTELQGMLAPFTPILVEESWEHTPASMKAVDVHPLRKTWTRTSEEWNNGKIETALPILLATNTAVKIAQERARTAKLMGSSLESYVTLLAPDSLSGMKCLKVWQGSAMRQMLVVSSLHAEFYGDERPFNFPNNLPAHGNKSPWVYSEPIELPDGSNGTAVVQQPESSKCERCWQYRADGQAYEDDLKAYGLDIHESEEAVKDEKEQLCVRCRVVVKDLGKKE